MIEIKYIHEYDEDEGLMIADIFVDNKKVVTVENTDAMGGFAEMRDLNKENLFLFLNEFHNKYANTISDMLDSEVEGDIITFNSDTIPFAIINKTEITFVDEEELPSVLIMAASLIPYEQTNERNTTISVDNINDCVKEFQKDKDFLVTKEQILSMLTPIVSNPLTDIILEGETNILEEQLRKSGWFEESSTEVEVKVMFNGIPVTVKDFNSIITEWWERMGKQLQEKSGLLAFEEEVEKRANELVAEKLAKLNGMITTLEDDFSVNY